MRSNWKTFTVGELVSQGFLDKPLDGNHGAIHPKTSDYVPYGVPFIMASDLQNGRINYNSCNYITSNQAHRLRKGFAKPGDVLLTHKATLGRTAIVDDSFEFIVLTPQVTYYRVIKDLDNRFIKYYFDSPAFQSMFSNWAASGSTRSYLGITAQRKLPIIVPPLLEQQAIAAILSCLDDKIDVNNRINANLEAQAQAIFKSWFVDFEPFKSDELVDSERGLIPKGWKVHSLSDCALYLNGLAMQKFRPDDGEIGIPVLKIRELRQGYCDSASERCSENIKPEYLIDDGDVVFSWSGSLLVDIWCGGSCGLNQHLFKVTSNSFDKWFYFLWTKHHLDEFIAIAAGKATTMGHIRRTDLDNAAICIPDAKVYSAANKLLTPIIEMIITNRIQNRTLESLRDLLLPKLMSGEIEVPTAESIIKERI